MSGTSEPMCLEAVPYRADLVDHLSVQHRTFYVQTRPCAAAGNVRQQWYRSGSQILNGVSNATQVDFCLSLFQDVAPGALEVWAGVQSQNRTAVVLFNRQPTAGNITVTWEQLGFGASQRIGIRDVVQHVNLGIFSGSFSSEVASHASKTLLLHPVQ
jgi:hypothetical protein